MADHLRTDLDQLFLQARQRPVLDRLRRRQPCTRTTDMFVFGPCEAIYDDWVPDWIKQGDYHSNRIAESSPITTGYTSNVLIDMVFVRRHGLRFEPELGWTGEDTLFFHAMYRKGGVLKYATNAVVYERVIPSRANVRWVVRRRYRAGQTRALVSRCLCRIWLEFSAMHLPRVRRKLLPAINSTQVYLTG